MLTSCASDNRGLQKRVTISTGTLAKKVGSALLQATAFAMFLVACSTPETPPDQLPRQAMSDTDYRLSPMIFLIFASSRNLILMRSSAFPATGRRYFR